MGCDIHLWMEKKNKEGKWETVDNNKEGRGQMIHGLDHRNYEVFSLLANVRNRDGIEPISEPRGFPEDMSSEAKEWSEAYDHSASYFTGKELLEKVNLKYLAELDDGPPFKIFDRFMGFWKWIAKQKHPENLRIIFYFDS